jgi:hypothetical protein
MSLFNQTPTTIHYYGNHPLLCARIVDSTSTLEGRQIINKKVNGFKTHQQLEVIQGVTQILLHLEEHGLEWRMSGAARVHVVTEEIDLAFYICEDVFLVFVNTTEFGVDLNSPKINRFVSYIVPYEPTGKIIGEADYCALIHPPFEEGILVYEEILFDSFQDIRSKIISRIIQITEQLEQLAPTLLFHKVRHQRKIYFKSGSVVLSFCYYENENYFFIKITGYCPEVVPLIQVIQDLLTKKIKHYFLPESDPIEN